MRADCFELIGDRAIVEFLAGRRVAFKQFSNNQCAALIERHQPADDAGLADVRTDAREHFRCRLVVARNDVASAEAVLDHFQIAHRSEEHTSELQSLMRISYAVFCLKKKKHNTEK